MNAGSKLPRWNLSSIYSSFDAPEYLRDKDLLAEQAQKLLDQLQQPWPEDKDQSARLVLTWIHSYEDASDLAENLESYASAIYTTDTRNSRALNEINSLETLALPLGKAAVILRTRLAERADLVLSLAETNEQLKVYKFFLSDALTRAKYQMAPELEDLANDLNRSGGDAWSRLQEAISSTVSALWDPATGEKKTVIALRDLAHNRDRAIRERAYKAELAAWDSMKIPLAASLNGVKGFAITVDKRRGWQSALDKAAYQSRISRKTLDALISVMEGSLPLFRRYLKAKARILGVDRCAFYDLFAPVGTASRTWTWEESRDFIIDKFSAFDPGMGNFARHAFTFSWIDAEGREGKIGGAYCTDFPLAKESRILCNFEGSFDSVTTVAHELGHAWHHEVLKDLPGTLAAYPMTLAETASTFAETIILEEALKTASREERLSLIEGNLKDACQIIVDILSRFYFERAVFKKREQGELSPEEFCSLMKEAQLATYGDGLDPELLHPYMWAVKSHYYSPALAFYNFPYAFGQLFAYGLYAQAREKGPAFAETYKEILRLTGRASAEDVGKAAGFDLEGPSFWQNGINLIQERVIELESLLNTLEEGKK
ncbi:MAG: M3 family oligoendopeptidase [Treponema sp.]|nr:M3 family oligoendopeptidase [Treponema sp.]